MANIPNTGTGAVKAVPVVAAAPVLAEELIKQCSQVVDESDDAPIRSRTLPPKPVIEVPVSDLDDTFEDDDPVATSIPASVPAPTRTRAPAVRAEADTLTKYQQQKRRVVFHIQGGTIMMTVTDVIKSATNIVIVLPAQQDGCVFIPKMGEDIVLEYDGNSYPCFVPGFLYTVEALGLTFLTLILPSAVNNESNV